MLYLYIYNNLLVDTEELNFCFVCYRDGRVRSYQLEEATIVVFNTLGFSITNDFQLIRLMLLRYTI